ncbi:hypothetical protein A0H81_05607 [Grifola frondosa]|uniref:Uncharacterized protein n=1 Tax=Grifola frondosa TaxID=5627 RepID=A0A1C7MDT9_GRIFR|nr:hypothetical protein A0H81_05607 [Grifola frondosa]
MAGLEDGPPGGLTTADRLEMVEKYQDAWRNLRFAASSPILSRITPLRMPTSHSGGVYSRVTANGDVEFCRIGSPIKGRQDMYWMLTRKATGLAAIGVCDVDCSQDLVVLSERTTVDGVFQHVTVHLRSAASGFPHPLASRPTLGAYTFLDESSIHGDIVALESKNTDAGLCVHLWNWKSGIMVLNIRSANSPGVLGCYTFVDEHHIMVTEHSYLAVHAFDPEAKTPSPPFDSSLSVNIQFSLESNPTRAVHGMPFQHRLADSVRLLEVRIGRSRLASCYICFFLSAVRACLQQASFTSQTWFAWEQWGPSGSRALTIPYGMYIALGTLGTKCLFLSWDLEPHCRVVVYEFNPWVVTGGPDAEQEVVVKHRAFAEPVCSRVRCRIDHWDKILKDVWSACLTEDGVVLESKGSELRAYVV